MTFSFPKVNFSLVKKKKIFLQKVDFLIIFDHMNVQNFRIIYFLSWNYDHSSFP